MGTRPGDLQSRFVAAVSKQEAAAQHASNVAPRLCEITRPSTPASLAVYCQSAGLYPFDVRIDLP